MTQRSCIEVPHVVVACSWKIEKSRCVRPDKRTEVPTCLRNVINKDLRLRSIPPA